MTTDGTDDTEATEERTDASEPAPRRRGTGRIAMAVSVFGELLITAGLVLGLFVVYSLWWTNVLADREAGKEAHKVRDNWAAADDDPGALDTKDGIGFLHVPAMKNGEVLVKKGTSTKILNGGVAGYYTNPVKATLPTSGKDGNFTLAAHRDGHGAKFHNIDKLKKGDAIVFETRDNWYVYKVYDTLPETSKYNVKVLSTIPKESGRKKPGKYITLTTCTPVYTSRHRYIVWGELVRVERVNAERTPPKELR
ncbi:class E sortase [Streptomyces ipomoeae]|uniref:Class E sortase n=1 Tax=Streptomyces ipomoeae TaxID=103232 RepID=A0A540PLF1_9ACTN|nr:class E sortase [Streptomyces ipomoeae]MDX2823263.1 class E sortase [Streptomyces ipomoeae]MDX2875832.1 class E sortase [Streptomyces ipomoeae]MDX2932466.1 class E sortase [Streptomyces ipomoeae]TQE22033.1 class E sortase [Streptomyces ipomoeae]TQE24030.1 class E sortase [Streptomyces ipomoeae]